MPEPPIDGAPRAEPSTAARIASAIPEIRVFKSSRALSMHAQVASFVLSNSDWQLLSII